MPENPAPNTDQRPPVAWFLYLIECADGSLYTGVAIDVAARYAVHARGKGARYTRSHPPLRLLASEQFPDRSSALKAEYRVKQLSPAAKRDYARALTLAVGETLGGVSL